MSTLKKLASQTAIYGASHMLGRLINYLLLPLQTRAFPDPADYGVITEFYSYVSFFIVVLTYGMETAFFRFSSKEGNNSPKFYSTALISLSVSSVLFILASFFFAQPVADLISHPNHAEYITWFAFILGLDAMASIPFAYLRQQNRPIRFAIIKNMNIGINIMLNVYFLWICPHVKATYGTLLPFFDGEPTVAHVFIANLVASAVTLPFLFGEIKLISNGFDATIWKKMFRYGLPMLVVGLGGMVNETLDRSIMKYLIADKDEGMRQLGIYGANYKLAILMTMFIQAYRYASEPFFFSSAEKKGSKELYAKVMDYFVVICLFLFLLVVLFIDQFKYFMNPSYFEGLAVVPVLLLANLCLGVYISLSIWYKLSDQTNKGAVISLIGAAITIALNIWWIPIYGYTGSAWATLICYFAMMVISYIWGQRHYPIPYHTGKILFYAFSALIIFVFSKMWVAQLTGDGVRIALNILLLLLFAGMVFLFERKNKAVTSRS